MKSRNIRILCVDDHAFLIEGLQARFELERDLEFIGSLSSAEHLVKEAKHVSPDIVLLDIEMPGPDPFDVTDDLRKQCPNVKVVFLSAYVRDHYISAATKSGAWGYLSKSEDADTIVNELRKVARGEFAFSPKVQERCKPARPFQQKANNPPSSRLDTLTPREQEVLRMIGRGMSRIDIANTLSRSPKTVDGHRESIMHKLDIHDRGELVRFAISEGLVEI